MILINIPELISTTFLHLGDLTYNIQRIHYSNDLIFVHSKNKTENYMIAIYPQCIEYVLIDKDSDSNSIVERYRSLRLG